MLDLYDAVATQEVPYPRHKPISYELQARQGSQPASQPADEGTRTVV